MEILSWKAILSSVTIVWLARRSSTLERQLRWLGERRALALHLRHGCGGCFTCWSKQLSWPFCYSARCVSPAEVCYEDTCMYQKRLRLSGYCHASLEKYCACTGVKL